MVGVVRASNGARPCSVTSEATSIRVMTTSMTVLVLSRRVELNFNMERVTVENRTGRAVLVLTAVVLMATGIYVCNAPSVGALYVLNYDRLILQNLHREVNYIRSLARINALVVVRYGVRHAKISRLH